MRNRMNSAGSSLRRARRQHPYRCIEAKPPRHRRQGAQVRPPCPHWRQGFTRCEAFHASTRVPLRAGHVAAVPGAAAQHGAGAGEAVDRRVQREEALQHRCQQIQPANLPGARIELQRDIKAAAERRPARPRRARGAGRAHRSPSVRRSPARVSGRVAQRHRAAGLPSAPAAPLAATGDRQMAE